jgi:hypothetical protein
MLELSQMTLLAHAGHWAQWALYAVPVVAVLVAIVVSAYRARHLDEEGRDEGT